MLDMLPIRDTSQKEPVAFMAYHMAIERIAQSILRIPGVP